jgi:hypothetical protein
MAPDEVAAVLRRDEEVVTRQDPRHRWNGGGQGRTVVKTPMVLIGDRAIADGMSSSAGEEVVVTHVMNNWDRITGGRLP